MPDDPRALETLQRNLAALDRAEPALAKRLRLPVASEQVRVRDGQLERCARRAWRPLQLDDAALADCLSLSARQQGVCVLFGLGDGAQVLALLRAGARQVVAWDRDPWLMRIFLEQNDLASELANGRLKLLLASDLADLVELLKSRPLELWPHPTAQIQYASEWAFYEAKRGAPAPLALVATGELFVDDLEDALRAEGYRVYPFDTSLHAVEELSYQVLRLRPALVAAINYRNGLAELCERLQTPLLSWEIDPTTDLLRPLARPCPRARIFTYREKQVSEFLAAGFSHAGYLPLAADPERRHPPGATLSDRYRAPLSFVGASLQAQQAGHRLRLHSLLQEQDSRLTHDAFDAALLALLAEQAQDFSRYEVPGLFSKYFPNIRVQPTGLDPIQLIAELAAAQKRTAYLTALGPLGIHIWGDEGFRALASSGACCRGPAGHHEELNQIYGHSAINVDIGRIYQADIVTMRVFDALACGGFVLTERSDALAELFELEAELATYATLAELLDKARYFLAHPEEAARIAGRGRARVLRDHTIRQRAQTMLRGLDGEAAQAPPA